MHATIETKKRGEAYFKSNRSRNPFRIFWSIGSFLKRHVLCIFTVIIPTALAITYFGFISSDIYVSESSFVVRAPQSQPPVSSLGPLLQSTGVTSLSPEENNPYTVQKYLSSRDALKELNDTLGLETAWSDKQIDFLHRFGIIRFTKNFEFLYLYYLSRIEADVDSHSDVIDLKARGFSADQAYQINQTLLDSAERMVNDLNEKARADLVGYAEAEVDRCEQALKEATVNIADYRNQHGVVDPHKEADVNYQLISSLQAQLIDTKTQLANAKAFAPDSPQPATLELRAKTLQSAMDAEMGKLAGDKNSLSTVDAVYEQLVLDQKVKEQQLDLALNSLETARNQAGRQQLYLEVISKPIRPDIAMEPQRFVGVLVTLLIGLAVWGISSMLIAGIREHQM